jgi:hypothetical protein
VPPDALQEVLQAAHRFKDQPSLMKAIRYAAAAISADAENVLDMAMKASLRNFIRGMEVDSSNENILQLGRSGEQVRDFLKVEIGPDIWDSLSEYSQNDLTEAGNYGGFLTLSSERSSEKTGVLSLPCPRVRSKRRCATN